MTKRPTLTLNNSKKNAHVKSNNTVFENKVNTRVKDEVMKPEPDTTQTNKGAKLEANSTSSNSRENVKKVFITEGEYNQILSYFKEHYPKLFPKNKNSVPLALGIHKQIFAADVPFSNIKVRRFLHKYTRSWQYQKCLMAGRNRLGINGEAASKVSEQEIAYFKEKRQRREESIKKANHDSLISATRSH